jgi:membrane protein implicated in regulation of membrane protease activity
MELSLSTEIVRNAWIVMGVVLILLEFIVPGAVVIFFGFGALAIATAVHLHWISSITYQLFGWLCVSLVMVILLRKEVARLFPALESFNPYDEYQDMKGRTVEVLEDVYPDSDVGRVRYQGSSWKARSEEGIIRVGSNARIIRRDYLTIWVKPL